MIDYITCTMTAMNLPDILTLTEAARERARFLLRQKAGTPLDALKIGVKNGGCAGMAYTVDYGSTQHMHPLDELKSFDDVPVIIDHKAILFLFGTELDYKTDELSSMFVFNNPNQISSCGCGESVEIKPIDR